MWKLKMGFEHILMIKIFFIGNAQTMVPKLQRLTPDVWLTRERRTS
jgi:hypothetical protein